jgi:DNA-binding transcriptional LysR family regulator
LFPEPFIQPWIESGEIQVILRSAAPPQSALWIVHPSRTLLAPAVRAVIDYIKTAFDGSSQYRPVLQPPRG